MYDRNRLLIKMEIILRRHSLYTVLSSIYLYNATFLFERHRDYHAVLHDGALPITCYISPYSFGRQWKNVRVLVVSKEQTFISLVATSYLRTSSFENFIDKH